MNRQWNNIWRLLCSIGFVGGLLLLSQLAWGEAHAQDPTPTLPPAVWMTPVSGEETPALAGPNYLLWGGIALILLILIGAALLLVISFFVRRRKAKRRDASAVFAKFSGYALVAQTGPGAGARYPLAQEDVLLGRSPDCQVVINFPNISGHHAQITWDGQQFVVQDLNSTNGTFVNGCQLTEPIQLQPGDVLSLGGSVELALQGGKG